MPGRLIPPSLNLFFFFSLLSCYCIEVVFSIMFVSPSRRERRRALSHTPLVGRHMVSNVKNRKAYNSLQGVKRCVTLNTRAFNQEP
ncbi:hypothetical protein BDV32DRAFT_91303 [Aspergillus pseudonomiae]|nr:hypothetical protein BDV32DRAFT_91303 [Aspergillus pseudonomiae]